MPNLSGDIFRRLWKQGRITRQADDEKRLAQWPNSYTDEQSFNDKGSEWVLYNTVFATFAYKILAMDPERLKWKCNTIYWECDGATEKYYVL